MTETLYDGPIVDAHHHLWDLSMGKHPWLSPNSAVPLPGLEDLRHDYLVDDYLRDSARHNVVATVHVEALWDAADPLGETRWLETPGQEPLGCRPLCRWSGAGHAGVSRHLSPAQAGLRAGWQACGEY